MIFSSNNFTIIVWVWTGIALILFPVLLKITAPYGRHSKSTWGPLISNRTGWFLMEAPALLLFVFFVATGKGFMDSYIRFFFTLWIIHYFHRAVIFPLRIKSNGKKMPVIIMALALFFNFINGSLNGYWFGHLSPEYTFDWILDMRFITGILLFVTGFIINQYHDWILIKLRKSKTNNYQIPKGGLFRYISCPNFLGEMLEWGGFALLTWCLPATSFFIWTIVNLVPRAIDHHRWYQNQFNDYPKSRKALIPYVL